MSEETERVLLAGAASLGWGWGVGGGSHQANRISSSSSSDSLAHSHLAAPVWCCRNTVRLRRVTRDPSVVYKATAFCTWLDAIEEDDQQPEVKAKSCYRR